jgi:glycine/D-amino acid oxidase-like deaminating enzyme
MRGEVLIIGGGLIGSSIAWRLAQKGAQVTIADAGNLGGEASPAGAGMLSPGAEFGTSPLLRISGSSLRLYPSFVRNCRPRPASTPTFECSCPTTASWIPRRCRAALRSNRAGADYAGTGNDCGSRDYAAVVIAAGAWSGQIHVNNVTLPAVVPSKAI